MVNQNAPHDLSDDGKELRSILPTDVFPIHHPQISLVDQGRRLQSVVGAFVLHIRRGEMPQIVIDKFEQLARRAVVPLANASKQEGHVMCWVLKAATSLTVGVLPRPIFSWAVSPLLYALLVRRNEISLGCN